LWYGMSMVLGWHLLNYPLGLLILVLLAPEMMSMPGVLQYTVDIFPSFLGITQLVYVVPMVIFLLARFSAGVLRGVLLTGCLTCIFSLVYYLGFRLSVLEYLSNSGLI
jgi:hypothetical protein